MGHQTQQMVMSIIVWAVVFGIFYLLVIKPQNKKEKELKAMRDNLKVGDNVTTVGGMIANVAKVEENTVVLEIGPSRTKVPFEQWAIATVNTKN